MEARQVKFRNMLDGNVQYRVPLFQRTYNWDKPQWVRLWDDLVALYGMDESRNHFVGSVVTQSQAGAAGGATRYSVIDGQQRMITLTILLCAIRDRAREESDKWGDLPDAIQEMYLINKFADASERNKFAPTKSDASAFSAMIDGDAPPGKTRIGTAWRYFANALNRGDANGKALDLRNLVNRVVSGLDIVSITLEQNYDNPNRIFESLNYTGLPLSAADLIRNYLFMNIRDADRGDVAYERYWFPMQEELGQARNVDRQTMFFWRYLAMVGRPVKKKLDAIFEGVRNLIGRDADDDAIVDALKTFHQYSHYYMEAVAPRTHCKNSAISDRIMRLHQWGAANAVNTFLMKSISHVHRCDIGADELTEVIDMIESFLVRRHVHGYALAGLGAIFERMLKTVKFTEGEFTESSLCVLRKYYWPNDAQFIEGLLEFPLYAPKAKFARARMILNTLELRSPFRDKEAPDPMGKRISIEHVMPQNLTRKWQDALGPDAVAIQGKLLHTLGNLTLTAYNPELGDKPFITPDELSDKPFPEKKIILADSKFALNSSFKDLDEWNAETIQQRGQELAKLAATIWVRPE